MESLYELSIVIPVYNVELYIEQCINNLICDNIPIDYEIIIVNDGSTDSSRNIIINIIDKNSDFNIKLLDKDNGGLSSARNYGLNFAKGRYIFFLDSDDFININEIYRMYNAAINYNCDLILGNGQFYYEGDRKNNKPFYAGRKLERKFGTQQVYSGKRIFEYMIKKNCYKMEVWDRLYKNEFLIKNSIHFMEGILHEDELFTPNVFAIAERVLYIGNIKYNYRQRIGSITKVPGIKNCKDYIKVISQLDNLILNNCDIFNKAISERIVQLYFRIVQVTFVLNEDEKKEVSEMLKTIDLNKYKNLIGFNINYKLRELLLIKNERLYILFYKIYKKIRKKLTGKL